MSFMPLRYIAIFVIAIFISACGTDERVNFTKSYSNSKSLNNLDRFKNEMVTLAVKEGVRRDIAVNALADISIDRRVIENQQKQPEFVTPVWDYINKRVDEGRIIKGRNKIADNKSLFNKLEKQFGVDYAVIAAIFGIETNYGSYTGKKNIINALATLAYEGSRVKYGRQQLIAALKILQNRDITKTQMTGSWAGAMGQTQFIPTTYLAYAYDFNGDGKRDIWNNLGDALGSAANYMEEAGWKRNVPWGYEVNLPKGFNFKLAGYREKKPISFWKTQNVRLIDGKALQYNNEAAGLFLPTGANGPAFLVFNNFNVIMRYNNSTSYALAVGLLSNRLKGKRGVSAKWPVNEIPLTKAEKKVLQSRLNNKGYNIGNIDGKIGSLTKEAIRNYQSQVGLVPDGYPSRILYRKIVRK